MEEIVEAYIGNERPVGQEREAEIRAFVRSECGAEARNVHHVHTLPETVSGQALYAVELDTGALCVLRDSDGTMSILRRRQEEGPWP